jgi:uncharacterized membrane protein YfcA
LDVVTAIADVYLVYAVVASVGAGLFVGFTGFGGGLIMSPLFAIIFGPTQAVILVALSALLGGAQLLPQVRRLIAWREAVPVALAACLTIPFGTHLLITGDPETMRRVIGGLVLGLATVMLCGWSWRGGRHPLIGGGVGLATGVVAGLGAVSGPIYTLYFLSASIPAAITRSNIVLVSSMLPAMTLASLFVRDVIDLESLARFAVLIVPYTIGIRTGARFFRRASDRIYRRLALGFIFVVGLIAVLV